MNTARARLGSWGAVALLALATVGGDLDQTSDAAAPADTSSDSDGTEETDPEQTDPDQADEPRITFCDERGDGWTPRSRRASVVLERHVYHSGNIIPAFTAVIDDLEVSYPGLNLSTDFGDGVTGRDILGNNCEKPSADAAPPPPESRSAPTTTPPTTIPVTTTTTPPPADEPVSPSTSTPSTTTSTTTTTAPPTTAPPTTEAPTTTIVATPTTEPPPDDAPPASTPDPEPTNPAPTTAPATSPSSPDTAPPATTPRSDSQSSPPASGGSGGSGSGSAPSGDGGSSASPGDDDSPTPVIVFGGGDPGFVADAAVASGASGSDDDAAEIDEFAQVDQFADAAPSALDALDPTQVSGETQSSLEPVAAIGFSLVEERSRTTLVIAAIIGLILTAIAFLAAMGVATPGRGDDF